MDIIYAVILGAVQGLTEFLPISSTGHLIIFEKIFNLSPVKFGLAFDASLHLGTLLAVAVFFYKDYLNVLNFKNKLYLKIIIATIPAVIIGLLMESKIETSFRSIQLVALAMIFFSPVIYRADKIGQKSQKQKNVNLISSLIIGFAQSLALIPGISRSGATISAGLFLGMTREQSARFAFMISGPIIAGAGLKKFSEVITSAQSYDLTTFIVGIISSAIFGYLTIKYFIKYLSTNNLLPFIAYRVAVGILILIFL